MTQGKLSLDNPARYSLPRHVDGIYGHCTACGTGYRLEAPPFHLYTEEPLKAETYHSQATVSGIYGRDYWYYCGYCGSDDVTIKLPSGETFNGPCHWS